MTDTVSILPFEHLLRVLRLHGYFFGVDTHVRLSAFWEEFSDQKDWTREDLKHQLAALLCRSGEQQEKFYGIFENYAPDLMPLEGIFELPPPPEIQKPIQPPTPIEEKKPPIPPPTPPVPVAPTASQRTGPVYPLLAFPDDPLRVWNLGGMTEALIPLREKVWTQTQEWDLPGTIRHSIRSGGRPEIAFKRRKQAPRYLALIEQKSLRDHLAGFCAALIREFSRRDLDAEFYFFDKTPARCWKVLRQPRTHVHLELLAGEYEGAKLLLMGNATCFTNALTHEPSNLAIDIRGYWQDVALLATNSPLEWSAAERSLDEIFPVLPLHLDGLNALPGAWSGVIRKTLTDWQQRLPEPIPPLLLNASQRPSDEILVELYRYLGQNAFRWLCADAVYPEIYFELTTILHNEAVPPEQSFSEWQQNAIWHDALKLLSRLEWFRLGFLPETMEERLRTLLPPADLGSVETEIRRILEWSKNAVPAGSHAEMERANLFGWLGGRTFRALWIDDHIEHDMQLMADLQQELGIVFRTATSMAEAKTFLHEPFDLILSDLGRKEEPETGKFTVQNLKELGIATPVIFFTNKQGMNLRGTLMEQGAHDVTNEVTKLKDSVRALFLQKFPPPEPPVQQTTSPGDLEDGHPEGGPGTPEEAEETNADEYAPPYQQTSAGYEPPLAAMDDSIALAQSRLITLGFYKGKADGIIGPKTKAAIAAFQKSKGLIADGLMGPQTRAALEKAEAEQAANLAREIPENWRQIASAVCQITLPSGSRGTGFLAGNGYVFTAGFLIPNVDALNRANAVFADPEGMAAYTFELDEKDFFRTGEGNEGYTRLRIKDWNAEKTALFGQIAISASGPNTDSRVSLIYFGTGTELKHLFSLDKPLRGYSETELKYEGETENGASGAPIFNAMGEVLGVHLAKVEKEGVKRGVRIYPMPAVGQETPQLSPLEKMKTEWKELVAKGEMDEVFHKMRAQNPGSNDLVLLQSQWSNIQKEERQGTITHDGVRSGRSRITNALLQIIDEFTSNTAYSDPAAAWKEEVRAMVAQHQLDDAFKTLRERVPQNDELTVLSGRWNRLKRDRLQGLVEENVPVTEENQILQALLSWLDTTELSNPAPKSEAFVLVQIPKKAKLREEIQCHVRVAFERTQLMQERTETEHDNISNINLPPGTSVVAVRMVDATDFDVWNIGDVKEENRTLKESEYVEWVFFAECNKVGSFPVEFIVTPIQGEARKEDIFMKYEVEIVPPDSEEEIASRNVK